MASWHSTTRDQGIDAYLLSDIHIILELFVKCLAASLGMGCVRPFNACPGNHDAVVSAESRRRAHQLQASLLGDLRKRGPHLQQTQKHADNSAGRFQVAVSCADKVTGCSKMRFVLGGTQQC